MNQDLFKSNLATTLRFMFTVDKMYTLGSLDACPCEPGMVG